MGSLWFWVLSVINCFQTFAGQCIFLTTSNYKAIADHVHETTVVDNIHNDCQLLCYTRGSLCDGASIVPLEDGNYSCELVSGDPGREYVILELNPDGLFITRLGTMICWLVS